MSLLSCCVVRTLIPLLTPFLSLSATVTGFWDQYNNIFQLLGEELNIIDQVLTGYAEQGQYSRNGGLEAVWPVYRQQFPRLPTGLAQAAYTRFLNLSLADRLTAFPLVLAFSEFDDSAEAWKKYDAISFRDLCVRLGVSRKCYNEAFEPMILTGLFAPGAQVSAAAALGMAYFFVLSNQNAFDVRWCKGNIGEAIFDPWIKKMQSFSHNPVHFQTSTRVVGFELDPNGKRITGLKCVETSDSNGSSSFTIQPDVVVLAVGASALKAMVFPRGRSRSDNASPPPALAANAEFRRFANLRGTSVLATRLYLDRKVSTPYTANACWGFDHGVGMTFFNIGALHGIDFADDLHSVSENDKTDGSTSHPRPQTIIEVDYYHSDTLLAMTDEEIVQKAKQDLDDMLGPNCREALVVDAAIVRLPQAVNWYYPDSYKDMPDLQAKSLDNVYFAGDLVRNTEHGSWSQEKAYVSGRQVANLVLARAAASTSAGGKGNQRQLSSDPGDEVRNEGIIPLPKDEVHVTLGRWAVGTVRMLFPMVPSPVDFMF